MFNVTYMRKGDKLEVTSTQLIIDNKRIDNPNTTNVASFAKSFDLYPSTKTTPKYESVYTIVKRALDNKQVSTFADSKGLLANAKAASLVFGHQYRENYGAKPQTIQDVQIRFYPYKVVDQTTGSKTACKVPSYYSISSNGKESDLKRLDDPNSVKAVGKEFEKTKFGEYAMSTKYQDLFKQIKQMGMEVCAA